TTVRGATSRTAKVLESVGVSPMARCEPTPKAIPQASAAVARSRLTCSARSEPPVMPVIISGALRVLPNRRVESSTSSTLSSGMAQWTSLTLSSNVELSVGATSSVAQRSRWASLRRLVVVSCGIGRPARCTAAPPQNASQTHEWSAFLADGRQPIMNGRWGLRDPFRDDLKLPGAVDAGALQLAAPPAVAPFDEAVVAARIEEQLNVAGVERAELRDQRLLRFGGEDDDRLERAQTLERRRVSLEERDVLLAR